MRKEKLFLAFLFLYLKEQMCDELIKKGKVRENDVIRHSYTNSRISGEMKDIQQNNISPTSIACASDDDNAFTRSSIALFSISFAYETI